MIIKYLSIIFFSTVASNLIAQKDSTSIQSSNLDSAITETLNNDTLTKYYKSLVDSSKSANETQNTIIKTEVTTDTIQSDSLATSKNNTLSISDSTNNTSFTVDSTLKAEITRDSIQSAISAAYNKRLLDSLLSSTDSTMIDTIVRTPRPKLVIPGFKTSVNDDLDLNIDSLLGIKEEINKQQITFYLTVLDSATLKPLAAQIKFISIWENGKSNNGQSKCDANGKFKTLFTDHSHFIIHVNLMGYKPFKQEFLLENEEVKNQKFEFTCKIAKFKVGDRIKLDAVYFNQNQYQLLQASSKQLDELVEFMKMNPTLQIRLNGHTDYGGQEDKNLELSLNRVKSVRFHLIQGGIKLSRIEVKGYGGTQPATNLRDPESRKQNRRVEFEILKI